jgi:hypothetical protein
MEYLIVFSVVAMMTAYVWIIGRAHTVYSYSERGGRPQRACMLGVRRLSLGFIIATEPGVKTNLFAYVARNAE